ncbi:hypothetical protein BDR03DRAFT_451693 [Suillus americanus]|nr:hypothetical protein BDR03DRAFT_451693 [Suillus americanus]
MDENNPPRKTRWGRPKPSHSDPRLVQEGGMRATSQDSSSLLPSRNGSRGQLSGLVPKLFGKVTKRFARSARQSLNLESMAISSGLQDIQPVQSTKDLGASTHGPKLEQSSNSGIVEVEHLNPKSVNERIDNATKDLAGIGKVPTIAQNTSSAVNNLQSGSGTVDTFSALLRPLKAFNIVASEIANLHPYAKVALSIFTCASKMILDQADRDVAVSGLLSKISEVYTFITEKEELAKIESMLAIYRKIAQQTLECADFISHYSETKSACKLIPPLRPPRLTVACSYRDKTWQACF